MNTTKPISLKRRFLLLTTAIAIEVMLVSVFIIDVSYRNEFRQSLYETLRLHIFSIMSVTESDDDSIYIPDIFYNPKLNTLDSGLWAAVLDENKNVLWQSLSVERIPKDIPVGEKVGDWKFDSIDQEGHTVLTASYYIAWNEGSQAHRYYFIAAENQSVLDETIQRFRLWLFGGFSLITLVLLICQIFALHKAFRPINKLEDEIALLEEGKQGALSPDYPVELNGVTSNLNALIEKEHNQRERYRSCMADLAHSLKTPMAIINNEIKKMPHNEVMNNAIQRIDQSIEYQLRRAVMSGHTIVDRGVSIQEVLDLVLEALAKLYSDKGISIRHQVDKDLLFIGDENDLMEIFGNLLDNAYKYAHQQIHITVTQDNQTQHQVKHQTQDQKQNQTLTFVIEDDGEGFCETKKTTIFTRGERLDQQNLGQGIGLAVVYDIVKNYNGQIESATSPLGGALFRIMIPFGVKTL